MMQKSHQKHIGRFDQLRKKAQQAMDKNPALPKRTSMDIIELISELEIHQIELQIQNDELRRAHAELSELYKKYSDLYEFAPCGYLNINPKGIISRINLAGVRLLGDSRRSILRTGFSQYVAEGARDLYHRALSKAGRTGEKQDLELQLNSAETSAHWVWAEIEAERDPKGVVSQWRMTLADISPKKMAEAARQDSEKRYRNLFAAMVSGAVVFEIAEKNNDGTVRDVRFIEVNTAFERLTGLRWNQVAGKTIRQVWPDSEQIWFDQVEIARREGRSRMEGFFGPLNKHFLFSAFKLDGRRFGATFSDISARVAMEEALKTRVKESTAEMLDANTALRVVLRQSEERRHTLEEQMICNLNETVRPHLDRIAASNLSPRQRMLLDTVCESLDSIASPLSHRFLLENMRLTPTESRVAGLIRKGKSTKDIAEIIGVATSTIDFHRHNIRHKLKLGRGTNLQSHLNSFE